MNWLVMKKYKRIRVGVPKKPTRIIKNPIESSESEFQYAKSLRYPVDLECSYLLLWSEVVYMAGAASVSVDDPQTSEGEREGLSFALSR